jgi:hypothetical protein
MRSDRVEGKEKEGYRAPRRNTGWMLLLLVTRLKLTSRLFLAFLQQLFQASLSLLPPNPPSPAQPITCFCATSGEDEQKLLFFFFGR